MRINIIILNAHPPDIRVHKQAKSLSMAGHDVKVYALWEEGYPEAEEIDGYTIKRIRLNSRYLKDKIFSPVIKYLELIFSFIPISIERKADVFIAHDAKALPIAWLSSRTSKSLLIYDARELETGRNFSSSRIAKIYQRFWSLPEKLFIRSTDAVFTVSDGIADELIRLYSVPRPIVIRNISEYVGNIKSNRLREELGIPKDQRIILYQGGVVKGRGIEVFLDAIQQIPSVAGVVLGDGPLLPILRERVTSGQWERVHLPGWIPLKELTRYTASADLGMVLIEDSCLSHHYSLPNKLFECIQAGIPVIGSNLPEISRLIRAYTIGEIVDPNDIESVAAAITRIISNPEIYETFKSNTRRAAMELNWENESLKLLNLINELAMVGGKAKR